MARAWPPAPAAAPLSGAALAELARALEPADAVGELLAVRAAVLLARSGDPRAIDVVLARLEQRWMGPGRASDAGDVVAAAGLAGFPATELLSRAAPARLVELATGPAAHPDLEVRVEVAALALALGRDEPIPFLLSVLRAGTAPEPWPDFERKPTLAWSKFRAAAALSARAGVPVRFNPEGSFAEQRAEAQRLAQLLAAGRPSAPPRGSP